MFDSQLLTFIGVAALLILTPGADTMLILRTVLARGQRAGILAALGICSGLVVHALLSALGLSIILMRSALAFEVVKWVGACYLVFLGIQSLMHAARNRNEGGVGDIQQVDAPRQDRYARSYIEGVLSNLLNPKVALFYLAFLPQFVRSADTAFAESIALAAIHLAMSLIWLYILVVFIGRLRLIITQPRFKRGLEGATGVLLVGLGVRLALERR